MRKSKHHHRSRYFIWCYLFLVASWVCPVAGQDLTPLQLVKVTVNDVVAEMNTNEALYEGDQEKLRAMVLERVAPHFNFERMTQLAMANHWAAASPEQRRQISDEMLQLMVRTYAASMFKFRNHPLTLEGEKLVNPHSAMVRIAVITDAGQRVSIILRMENRKGPWLIIDAVIDGVSMVITYRGTFGAEISKSGIDGLISSIKTENLQRVAP